MKQVNSKGFNLNLWDIGGQKAIRPYWQHYFDEVDVLVRSVVVSIALLLCRLLA